MLWTRPGAIAAPIAFTATTGAAVSGALTAKSALLKEGFDPLSAIDFMSLAIETGYMAGAGGLIGGAVLGAPISGLAAACYGVFQGGKALKKRIAGKSLPPAKARRL